MNPFLENLKKSVDAGEFNSEAAKKINEINKLADIKAKGKSVGEMENIIKNRLDAVIEAGGNVSVSPEEAIELNAEYEKEMEKIKKQDAVNQQTATLMEIEDMVKLSIGDMLSFAKELEDKFAKEFKDGDSIFTELYTKIQEIKIKYNSNINN